MSRFALAVSALLLVAPSLYAQQASLDISAIEGMRDTVEFHIGSPFFLRLDVHDHDGCRPFDGTLLYSGAGGVQNGWGFEEVADTALFPVASGRCERVLMLSSENSNRVAEGWYPLAVAVSLENGTTLRSNRIVLHAVRSAAGADRLSYARFLMEQIVRHTQLLRDPETLSALFAEGTPQSAESEILRALILMGIGDPTTAAGALRQAERLAARRPMADYAARVQERLNAAVGGR